MKNKTVEQLAEEEIVDALAKEVNVPQWLEPILKDFALMCIKGCQAKEERYSIVQILEILNDCDHLDDGIAYFYNNPTPPKK